MTTSNRRSVAALAACLVIPPAAAADKELLDVLLGNGAITPAQYQALLAKSELKRADIEDITLKVEGPGLSAESRDGDQEIRVGSRLHVQAAGHDGDLPAGVDATDGTGLRRARFEMSGRFQRDFTWAAEADFADDEVSIKDFRIGYVGFERTNLSLGNQKQPYSLSVEMSSNDMPFIERSVDNELVIPFVDRAIGARIDRWGEHWFFAGGVFGEDVSATADDDEGVGAAARLVWSPVIEADRILHLGVRAAVRTPSASTDAFRISDETTHFSNLAIVDTGSIPDIRRANLLGAEAAIAWKAFSLVGEYNTLRLDRSRAPDLDFESWHVYGTWTLSGESRASAYRIDAGEFKRIHPARPFNTEDGTWGAWELAVRYAHVDLNDGSFSGGEESVLTTGLNWYLNRNIRLMFEHSLILDTDASTALRAQAEGLDIYQFRTQYAF